MNSAVVDDLDLRDRVVVTILVLVTVGIATDVEVIDMLDVESDVDEVIVVASLVLVVAIVEPVPALVIVVLELTPLSDDMLEDDVSIDSELVVDVAVVAAGWLEVVVTGSVDISDVAMVDVGAEISVEKDDAIVELSVGRNVAPVVWVPLSTTTTVAKSSITNAIRGLFNADHSGSSFLHPIPGR